MRANHQNPYIYQGGKNKRKTKKGVKTVSQLVLLFFVIRVYRHFNSLFMRVFYVILSYIFLF